MIPTPSPELSRNRRIIRGILIGALALLGLWIIHPFLPALVWAAIIAVAVDPLVCRLEARSARPRPNLIALAITLAFALLLLVPLAFGITQAAREAHDLAVWIAAAREHGLPPPPWLATLPFGSGEATHWWQENLATPATASE